MNYVLQKVIFIFSIFTLFPCVWVVFMNHNHWNVCVSLENPTVCTVNRLLNPWKNISVWQQSRDHRNKEKTNISQSFIFLFSNKSLTLSREKQQRQWVRNVSGSADGVRCAVPDTSILLLILSAIADLLSSPLCLFVSSPLQKLGPTRDRPYRVGMH